MRTSELATAVELHYEQNGTLSGAPLIMGGSLGTTLAMWNPQVEALPSYRLIRFDHRGHGGSPRPPGPYSIATLGADVLTLLDRLELERVSYCGLSIGGMVGMWLAANAPERVDKLVLLCTSAHLPPATAWIDRAKTVRRARSLGPIADTVVDRWLTPGFARTHPAARSSLRTMLVSSDPAGYAACCEAIAGLDLRGSLAAIEAPALVIAGSNDLAIPKAHSELIVERIPNARLAVVAPAAHIASFERPDEINRLIASHLSTQESS